MIYIFLIPILAIHTYAKILTHFDSTFHKIYAYITSCFLLIEEKANVIK